MSYRYQNPGTSMTLAEGLAELGRVLGPIRKMDSYSMETKRVMAAHDACHVVFGTGVTVSEEIKTHTWGFWASSLSKRDYLKAMATSELREAYPDKLDIVFRFLTNFPSLFLIYIRSSKMKSKWPIADYEKYIDWPLHKIREKFGIQIVT